MDWIQQWQSKLNKQNGVAPLVRTGGSRHTGLAALPHRNIHAGNHDSADTGSIFKHEEPPATACKAGTLKYRLIIPASGGQI